MERQDEKLCDEVETVTGNIGEAMGQDEKLCDEVGTVTGNIGEAMGQDEKLCDEVGTVTGNIGEAMGQDEKLCDEVETDNLSSCSAASTKFPSHHLQGKLLLCFGVALHSSEN